MKYILELEDEPNKEYFGEGNYYRCKQIPYWSISESMRNRLEPYDEADRKTENSSEKPNNSKKRRECPWCKAVCASTDKYCHECGWHIADTPQTDLVEDSDDLVKDLVKDTPQTDCGWGKPTTVGSDEDKEV